MTLDSPARCKCGAALPAGWAAPSCPRCLVRVSVEATDPARVFPHGSGEISLGDYELLDEIARGGMGVVYRARQQRLGRIVAVKVLAAGEFASAAARERFRTEAAAAARLQHPGIVAIHDVGEAEGLPWFSMELIAGGNLATLVREQPLPARQAAEYVRAIAEAVQHAHDHGVLHRDLKPSNILLDPESGPRITDFGIARCGDAGDITRTGEVLGSPGYTAPEQALGGTADARTDVYGLGAVLYHLLTARPPFQGPTLDAIVLQLREADPLAPRRLNPAVPRDLETICLRCLRKDPANRYATAREVADDLARFQKGEAIRARPISVLEKAGRWCRRHPGVASLLALLAVVAALAFAFVDRARREEARAKVRAESASAQLRETNTRLADALDSSELDRASDLFRAGDSAEALAPLMRIVRRNPAHPVAGPRLASALWHGDFALPLPPPLIAFAVVERIQFFRDRRTLLVSTNQGTQTWSAPDSQRLSEFERDTGRVRAALSPDERTLVEWDANPGGNLCILEVATGRRRVPPIRHDDWIHTVDFSPDGSRFVCARGFSTVQIFDTKTGAPIGDPIAHPPDMLGAAFSPDGETIATCSGRTVRLWEGRSQNLLRESPAFSAGVRLLQFSPDGRWIAAASADGMVRLLATVDAQFAGTPMRHSDRIRTIAFSADGALVLTASDDHTARVWSVPGGEPLALSMRHGDAVNSAVFSPDGARIATTSRDNTARVWDVLTGLPLSQPLRHFEQPHCAVFAPDGATLFTGGADGMVQRWDLRAGTSGPLESERAESSADQLSREADTLRRLHIAPDSPVASVRVSPDGRTVLTATHSPGNVAQLWDAATGQPLGSAMRHNDDVLAAEFSPDGALVATASEDNTARIWDARTGARISPDLRHTRTVAAVAFSPDSRRVATASWDGTARIWDARTGAPLARALTHDDYVTDVQFSPDGHRIATASRDRTVRVWDAASGQPLTEPLRHAAPVVRVRFQPDGQRIVAGSADGTQRIWDTPDFSTPPPAWLAQLAGTISLAELPPSPLAARDIFARYMQTRPAAIASTGDDAYARLARRLFERRTPNVEVPPSK